MQEYLMTLFPLLAPMLLMVASLLAITNTGKRIDSIMNLAGLLGITISLLTGGLILYFGTMQSGLIGWEGIGLALRLDSFCVTMMAMISILGFVVLIFSLNYIEGDSRKSIFLGRLAVTIASVELLVLSGNLGQLLVFWVITSICLHYLLVFYRNRPQAIAAARKKFIVARLGDMSLLFAVVLLYREFDTGDLSVIFEGVKNSILSDSVIWATILLVITAVLKSAQFPTHGWLIEVVETPTPVSALLHAGLLNAGPFLMVRMSVLMVESSSASLLLIAIGGFTAMFASVVFLTQPSVKVGLGYSSIAHMGFSLLICGFGVYSAALLHVIAHSFYKAHSFLSSGSVIDSVRARKVKLPSRNGSSIRIGLSIVISLAIYVLFCYLWGINPNDDFDLMVTGGIIVMGLSQILCYSLDSNGKRNAVSLAIGMAIVIMLSFFTLEFGMHTLLGSQIPVENNASSIVRTATWVVIGLYALIIIIQLLIPGVRNKKIGYKLGIHLRNGLYVNVIFDRMIGSLKNEKFKWVNLTVQEDYDLESLPKKADVSVESHVEA